MVSLTVGILLACACVTINAEDYGNLRKACMKIRKGFTAGFGRHIKPIIIPQRQPRWEMPLPSCLGEPETGGVDVMVCDDEIIPNVKFTEPNSVYVQRTGSMKSFLIVLITLYCKTPQNQFIGEIPPPL